MGKVYLTSLRGEYGVHTLVSDGRMLRFNMSGKFLEESEVSFNVGTLQEVDIVSVLLERTNIEIAYNVNGNFSKSKTSRSLADIATTLNTHNGAIFAGRREGDLDGVKYSQYLYVFRKGTLTSGVH